MKYEEYFVTLAKYVRFYLKSSSKYIPQIYTEDSHLVSFLYINSTT